MEEWSRALGKSELARHLNHSDLGPSCRVRKMSKTNHTALGSEEGTQKQNREKNIHSKANRRDFFFVGSIFFQIQFFLGLVLRIKVPELYRKLREP